MTTFQKMKRTHNFFLHTKQLNSIGCVWLLIFFSSIFEFVYVNMNIAKTSTTEYASVIRRADDYFLRDARAHTNNHLWSVGYVLCVHRCLVWRMDILSVWLLRMHCCGQWFWFTRSALAEQAKTQTTAIPMVWRSWRWKTGNGSGGGTERATEKQHQEA